MYKFKNIFLILSLFICFLFSSSKSFSITLDEYIKINTLIEVENVDKAFEELKIIQKKETKLKAKSLILIGKIYLILEQPAKAYSFFEKALFTSVSTDDLAYSGMSLASIKLGNLDKAKMYAKKAIKENPDTVEGKIAMGLILSDNGQIEKSNKYFLKAILASKNSLYAVREYASSKMRLGQNKKAKDIINKALLEKKGDAPTIDLLGKLFWLEGNIKEAVKLRTDASIMFRKSGNLKRAEQIIEWLNNSASHKLEKIVKEETQLKIKKIKPKVDFQEKKIIKPREVPEKIQIDTQKKISTGSGFILNNGKWIITNRHVIDKTKYISVRNGLGVVRKVRSIFFPQDDQIDIAILTLSKPYPSNYSLSVDDITSPITGENIFVMGYPMSSIIGRYNPSITQGIISKNKGFGEMPGQFQITATMNLGNSGGPIFNVQGKIVGISVGKLDKKLFLKKEGFIPQDVNIGISGEVLRDFLKQKVKKLQNFNKESYNASEIYKIMRPSVVFVVGQ